MEELSEVEKTLVGFALFTTAMKMGPPSFLVVEQIAMKIGVDEQLKFYAKDWIQYSTATKTVGAENVSPEKM